ncbi:MAG: CoA transferase [Treponema sp.]|jgi:formyl-CoA transferase|nr:CoA transferase [Treponema sp.]
MRDRVLEGVFVVDLGRVVAGPMCSQMLADMGARVIKVEPPEGDGGRFSPPYNNGESGYYMAVNRNKEGIVLDLQEQEARDFLWVLIKKADILVENYRPGVMDKLGFSYEKVKEANPKIVYASVSAYGQYGPYNKLPGFDTLGQAMGGMIAAGGEPGGVPVKVGAFASDTIGGLTCAVGAMAALIKAKKTGVGKHVDTSLADSIISALSTFHYSYFVDGKIPEKPGNYDRDSGCVGTYKTKDDYITIVADTDAEWAALAEAMGKPGLYPAKADRAKHADEIAALINAWLADKEVKATVKLLRGKGVACTKVLNIEDMQGDDHITNVRGMFVDYFNMRTGKIKATANPIKYSESPTDIRRSAPLYGVDTIAILKEFFNLSDEKINDLRERYVVRSVEDQPNLSV